MRYCLVEHTPLHRADESGHTPSGRWKCLCQIFWFQTFSCNILWSASSFWDILWKTFDDNNNWRSIVPNELILFETYKRNRHGCLIIKLLREQPSKPVFYRKWMWRTMIVMVKMVIPTSEDHFQVSFNHTSPSWHSKLITFFNSLLCQESVGNNSWMSFCWRGGPAVACLFYLSPYGGELLFDSSAIQTCQHMSLRKCCLSVNHWYVYMLFVFSDSSL